MGKNIVCLKRFPGTDQKQSGVLEYRDRVIRLREFETWDEVRSYALASWKKLFPDALVLMQCVSSGFPKTPMTFMDTNGVNNNLTQSRILETMYFDAMNRAQAAVDAFDTLLRSIEGLPLDKYDGS